ncbi:MAG TPA: dihydrofolate reductase family protein, partial [Candidatus Saccharimonadales bacterium]|nr:dihydrofolate reductase family protein [Candidatus Saccharimonadales bacterium]
MRKLVVVEYVTLDNRMESPEKWTLPYWNDQIAAFQSEQLMRSDTLLLGRITFEAFAGAWSERNDDDFAKKMNSMEKLVATHTPGADMPWNGHAIEGDVVAAITNLKAQDGGDILVYGSATLLQTLVKHNLVDTYMLITYPVVLGTGKQLFADDATTTLNLVSADTSDTGVLML